MVGADHGAAEALRDRRSSPAERGGTECPRGISGRELRASPRTPMVESSKSASRAAPPRLPRDVAATAAAVAYSRPRSALISTLAPRPISAGQQQRLRRASAPARRRRPGSNQLPASQFAGSPHSGSARHVPAAVGRALEPRVVAQHELAVAGQPHVELDPAAAQRLSLRRSPASVFSGARAAAPRWPMTAGDAVPARLRTAPRGERSSGGDRGLTQQRTSS